MENLKQKFILLFQTRQVTMVSLCRQLGRQLAEWVSLNEELTRLVLKKDEILGKPSPSVLINLKELF